MPRRAPGTDFEQIPIPATDGKSNFLFLGRAPPSGKWLLTDSLSPGPKDRVLDDLKNQPWRLEKHVRELMALDPNFGPGLSRP